MREKLSAQATWRTPVPEILAVGGSLIAFFLLAEARGVAALMGLPAGIVAAMTARSTAKVTFDPADMTAQEKRLLLGGTPLVVVGLGILVVAFLVPAEWLRWRPPSLINYAPQVKAVLAYLGAFCVGIGLTMASGRPARRED